MATEGLTGEEYPIPAWYAGVSSLHAAAAYANCGVLELLTDQERRALQPWLGLFRHWCVLAGRATHKAQALAARRSGRR